MRRTTTSYHIIVFPKIEFYQKIELYFYFQMHLLKYEEMLDFALITEGNDDITNVAMTGLYGSGESSVIETYKKRKKDNLKFLSISLSH